MIGHEGRSPDGDGLDGADAQDQRKQSDRDAHNGDRGAPAAAENIDAVGRLFARAGSEPADLLQQLAALREAHARLQADVDSRTKERDYECSRADAQEDELIALRQQLRTAKQERDGG